jgi:DNA primase
MIPRDTIDQIFSALRIEEVVGDFVSLRKRGVNLIGLCPFHTEKTPSFTVSATKGIYKCFGCGKAGNAVNFLMEHEHLSYPDALRYLAAKYNIGIEEEAPSPEMLQELGERESLFNLNQFACDFFEHSVHQTEKGKAIGLSYFRERGFRDDIIRKFQLGYCPDTRDEFSRHALQHGYRQEILEKTGLSIRKDDRLFDRFSGRVIFPIHGISGRITGFGGRILISDKNRPKYINSPESEIYNKSKSLYGIYFARNAIAARDNCYLVEGYTDVIALFQAGIENVVASSGTSLTHEQVRLIRRFTENITVLYDGDPAGIKASFRGIDLIVEEGLNVKIVLFPDGEDPDSFTRSRHSSEVEAFITTRADNFILFKTRLLLNETKGDPIRKAALIKEIVSTIGLIPDGIKRTLYVRECSAIMNVSEQILMNEVRKILRNKINKTLPGIRSPEDIGWTEEVTAPQQVDYNIDSDEYQEKELIRLLLIYGDRSILLTTVDETNREVESPVKIADFIILDLTGDELGFENPLYARIFSSYLEAYHRQTIPDRHEFLSHSDPEISRTAVDLVFAPYSLSRNWESNNIVVQEEDRYLKELVITAILSFKVKKLDKIISGKQKEIRDCSDPREQELLLEELRTLKKSSIRVNRELGRIITR